MSRLQLLVEIIHQPYWVLSEDDKRRHNSLFGSYVKEDSLHYCYRVTQDEVAGRLQQIGIDLCEMVKSLELAYKHGQAFRDAKQVIGEHFRCEAGVITIKSGKGLSGSTLQSPDDPDNELQLVTAVSMQPNVTDAGYTGSIAAEAL